MAKLFDPCSGFDVLVWSVRHSRYKACVLRAIDNVRQDVDALSVKAAQRCPWAQWQFSRRRAWAGDQTNGTNRRPQHDHKREVTHTCTCTSGWAFMIPYRLTYGLRWLSLSTSEVSTTLTEGISPRIADELHRYRSCSSASYLKCFETLLQTDSSRRIGHLGRKLLR